MTSMGNHRSMKYPLRRKFVPKIFHEDHVDLTKKVLDLHENASSADKRDEKAVLMDDAGYFKYFSIQPERKKKKNDESGRVQETGRIKKYKNVKTKLYDVFKKKSSCGWEEDNTTEKRAEGHSQLQSTVGISECTCALVRDGAPPCPHCVWEGKQHTEAEFVALMNFFYTHALAPHSDQSIFDSSQDNDMHRFEAHIHNILSNFYSNFRGLAPSSEFPPELLAHMARSLCHEFFRHSCHSDTAPDSAPHAARRDDNTVVPHDNTQSVNLGNSVSFFDLKEGEGKVEMPHSKQGNGRNKHRIAKFFNINRLAWAFNSRQSCSPSEAESTRTSAPSDSTKDDGFESIHRILKDLREDCLRSQQRKYRDALRPSTQAVSKQQNMEINGSRISANEIDAKIASLYQLLKIGLGKTVSGSSVYSSSTCVRANTARSRRRPVLEFAPMNDVNLPSSRESLTGQEVNSYDRTCVAPSSARMQTTENRNVHLPQLSDCFSKLLAEYGFGGHRIGRYYDEVLKDIYHRSIPRTPMTQRRLFALKRAQLQPYGFQM